MPKNYDEELEMLMLHNPRGGKPQKIGATVYLGLQPPNSTIDISEIKEDTSRRFHLGYCPCGRKITAGEKRALILIKTLAKFLNIWGDEEVDAKMLKHIMKSYPHAD